MSSAAGKLTHVNVGLSCFCSIAETGQQQTVHTPLLGISRGWGGVMERTWTLTPETWVYILTLPPTSYRITIGP